MTFHCIFELIYGCRAIWQPSGGNHDDDDDDGDDDDDDNDDNRNIGMINLISNDCEKNTDVLHMPILLM